MAKNALMEHIPLPIHNPRKFMQYVFGCIVSSRSAVTML